MIHVLLPHLVNAITGKVIENLVREPSVPLDRNNAPDAAPAIKEAVTQAVNVSLERDITPRLEHLANREPWYQSRVTWGAIVAIGSGILALAGYGAVDENQQGRIVELLIAAGPIVGGGLALVGRWVSRKPIGA